MSESASGMDERAELASAEPIGGVSLQPTGRRKQPFDFESLLGRGKRHTERYALGIGSWQAIVVRQTGMRGTTMRLEQPKEQDESEPGWKRHHRERKLMRAAARRLGTH